MYCWRQSKDIARLQSVMNKCLLLLKILGIVLCIPDSQQVLICTSLLKSLNMHRHYAETQFKKKIENLLWIPYPVKLVQHFISSNPDWSRAHA